ncbi:MAG: hypothetical protein CM1200mP9_04230 [Gammaproteobacteria bacterium]|nr:MAG: hypothetical protein CM1200mP9_04230 [Gammaproteobacteria bacterium]
MGVAPHGCVFLDDLGINLKPAKALGMTTIKVVEEDQAIIDLKTSDRNSFSSSNPGNAKTHVIGNRACRPLLGYGQRARGRAQQQRLRILLS